MPKLSIVIAAAHGSYDVNSIRQACDNKDVEIVLVERGESEREMRLAGMERATGELVAVLGDRYDIGANWLPFVLASQGAAVSGPVEPATNLSRTGWAIYLAEYSQARRPVEGNVVFRAGWPRSGPVRFAPEMFVYFARPAGFREYLGERYRDSVAWARERSERCGGLSRLMSAASRLALPVLLIYRRSRNVISRRRFRARFLAALPYLLLFGMVETAGEIAGFLSAETDRQ